MYSESVVNGLDIDCVVGEVGGPSNWKPNLRTFAYMPRVATVVSTVTRVV